MKENEPIRENAEKTGAQFPSKSVFRQLMAKQNELIHEHSEKTGAQNPYMLKTEVAALIRKTPRTVEAWMKAGVLPYIKIGKGRRATVLFRRADIDAHLTANFGVGFSS